MVEPTFTMLVTKSRLFKLYHTAPFLNLGVLRLSRLTPQFDGKALLLMMPLTNVIEHAEIELLPN